MPDISNNAAMQLEEIAQVRATRPEPDSTILDETTMRLEEVAQISKAHFSSVYRWVLRGLPGRNGQRIRLEAIRVGRAWVTSKEALARFSAALTPRLGDNPKALPRSPNRRHRDSERAAQTLTEQGV